MGDRGAGGSAIDHAVLADLLPVVLVLPDERAGLRVGHAEAREDVVGGRPSGALADALQRAGQEVLGAERRGGELGLPAPVGRDAHRPGALALALVEDVLRVFARDEA